MKNTLTHGSAHFENATAAAKYYGKATAAQKLEAGDIHTGEPAPPYPFLLSIHKTERRYFITSPTIKHGDRVEVTTADGTAHAVTIQRVMLRPPARDSFSVEGKGATLHTVARLENVRKLDQLPHVQRYLDGLTNLRPHEASPLEGENNTRNLRAAVEELTAEGLTTEEAVDAIQAQI